jgi:uncharacterized protein HemX
MDILARVAVYVVLAFGLAGAFYAYTERQKETGRAEVRLAVAAQRATAESGARAMALRGSLAREQKRREMAAELAEAEQQIEALRMERVQDENADTVVFDERWAGWLRGSRADRPAGRPGS